MKLARQSREEPEINLTSLIDVVLLLLVFFMVSTSFVKEAEINIHLPEAKAQPVSSDDTESLEIGITATGKYLVDGKPLVPNADAAILREAMRRVMADRGFDDPATVPVIIRGDADSSLQSSATAITVAGELGFTKINIATDSRPDE